jgi:hypothetical protein
MYVVSELLKVRGVVDSAHLISAVTSNLDLYLVLMQTRARNPASHRYELAKGGMSFMVRLRQLRSRKSTQSNNDVSNLQVGKSEL